MNKESSLQISSNRPWFIIAILGLMLILAISLSGAVQNYLNAEEFLVFHYANNLPHLEAWIKFSLEYGRVFETIFWTYEYKLIGYNPILAHALSFVQILIFSMLGAKLFVNVWPQEKQSKWLPYFAVCAFSINWVAFSSVLRISYDNGRISLIFFFLSGLALQRWAVKQRVSWLLGSFVLFLFSLFTYENAVFLFPALLLLAWPLLPKSAAARPMRSQVLHFLKLFFSGGLLGLVPYAFYKLISLLGGGTLVPGMQISASGVLNYVLTSDGQIYLKYGQYAPLSEAPFSWLLAGSILIVLLSATVQVVYLFRATMAGKIHNNQLRFLCIYLASMWLLFFGPLPYVLLGYEMVGRVYSSAVFGLFGLLFLSYHLARRPAMRVLLLLCFVLHLGFGGLILAGESQHFTQRETVHNIFYRGLKQAVPHVSADTVFILINPPLGIQGCAEGMEMFYDQHDLYCVILSSNFDKYQSTRHADGLETDRYYLVDNNWILINVVDNLPVVLEKLEPEDFDLYLTWESEEPLRTNFNRIIVEDLPPPSAFYKHLLQRAEVLFDD